ncbi:hypothetical protein AVEN_62412-2 [Araneus ventricosus]|uniref:Uncharacterized protein n=1 Tax=Araneus ventricosus TaxID=182803 RepID=A0A4Y2MSZ0_ARAVE|nr:hypothetical protein AVEN_62412-2 [Araneus ventricosus]
MFGPLGVVLKSGDCGMEAACCSRQMSFFKRLDPRDRNNNYDRIDPNNNCDPGDQNNNDRNTEVLYTANRRRH